MRSSRPRPQGLAYFVAVPLAALAIVLTIGLGERHGVNIEWAQLPTALLYLGLFVLAQSIVLHFEVRRHSLNVTVGEIPLLLALFYLSPLLVVIVRPLALLIVQSWQRYSVVKFVFNLASTALATTVAAWIVAANPPHGVGPSAWFILAAAVGASVLISLVTVVGVISLVQGSQPWSMWTRTAISVLVVVAVNITVGLVVLRVLQGEPWSVVLLTGICVMLFYVYRAYAQFVLQQRSLAELYELTRAMANASRSDTLPDVMLVRVRELMQAEYATLWLAPQGRYAEQLLTARVDAPGLLDTGVTPVEVRERAVSDQVAIMVGPRVGSPELRPLVKGVKDAIVVPLRSGSAVIGTLEVCGRLGDLSWFGLQDLRLLETLAAHAAVAVENSRLVERLYHDAYHDTLTGLPNRRRVLAQLEEAVRVEAPSEVVAVILFDIDGLRDVNESLGHDAGDELVREVACRIRRLAPTAALVGRGGSDEFVITVRLPGADEAVQLASEVRAALQEPMVASDDVTLDVDVAVGIALYPDHADAADELLKCADLAAQRAKQLATPVHVFHHALRTRSSQRLALAADMRRALELGSAGAEGAVEVFFQPKVALLDRRVVGVECLARWNHPVHGQVAPTDFVTVAEHTGQLSRLTEVVLREALRRTRGWLEAGHALPVAVNLSTRTLVDPSLPSRVSALLGEYGVPAELLTLEITEDGMVSEPDRSMLTLNRLHEMGVRLAVDDFGTGYSSLAYLRRLPVDEVKIDRSFVQGMASDPDDLKIVSAVVDLARHFNLTVVAEGVESERTVSLLEGLGCDVGQGFLFSRALPYERFEAWLAAQTEPILEVPTQPGARRLRSDLGS